MDETRTSTRRPLIITVTVVVGVLALLYPGRLGLLYIGATEGDVPAAASIPLPAGSAIVQETSDCASGGCWALISVRPPEGMTPDELAGELGTTPQARIAGTAWDPRTISLESSPRGPLLRIRADYWSSEYIP